jgi:hypothetical protein
MLSYSHQLYRDEPSLAREALYYLGLGEYKIGYVDLLLSNLLRLETDARPFQELLHGQEILRRAD